MKKMRIIGWILGLLIVLALVVYHLPVKRSVSMPVCNGDGGQKQLEMELKLYRHLFGATTVKGTLVFDGVEFIDRISLNKALDTTQEESNRWWKYEGFLFENFMKMPSEDMSKWDQWTEAYSQQINIWEASSGLEQVMFFYTDMDVKNEDGSTPAIVYFGPAKTVEEAQKIADGFGYEISGDTIKWKSETFQ